MSVIVCLRPECQTTAGCKCGRTTWPLVGRTEQLQAENAALRAQVEKLTRERSRLKEYLDHKPIGTAAQRERQMLKRTESAETRATAAEAEAERLRAAVREIDDLLPVAPKLPLVVQIAEVVSAALQERS